ncbi:hypothetical protein PM082_000525 [Marasmius tenuissimus]|nr:hypothetical protein PM082_000525 [Marasmius tenuissimus]
MKIPTHRLVLFDSKPPGDLRSVQATHGQQIPLGSAQAICQALDGVTVYDRPRISYIYLPLSSSDPHFSPPPALFARTHTLSPKPNPNRKQTMFSKSLALLATTFFTISATVSASQYRAHPVPSLFTNDALASCGDCGSPEYSVVLAPADAAGNRRIACCSPVNLEYNGVKVEATFTHKCSTCHLGTMGLSDALYKKLNPSGGDGEIDLYWV